MPLQDANPTPSFGGFGLTGARVVSGPSPVTTVFENLYEGDDRKQRIHAMADPVSPGSLPEGWQGCPVVLLAPVTGEVDPSFAALFPRSLLGVSPQGWMRRWDSEGWVDRKCWSGRGVIDRADVVVVSEADFSSGRLPPSWLKDRAIVVLTHGRDGATVVHGGRRLRVPPYPAQEVDPTGGGGCFRRRVSDKLLRKWGLPGLGVICQLCRQPECGVPAPARDTYEGTSAGEDGEVPSPQSIAPMINRSFEVVHVQTSTQ